MKAMLKRQLKALPADQQDMIIRAIEENPKLFETIAKEIQEKVKKGVDKQTAAMQVMMAHQNELRTAMQPKK
ncbi:MAG: hypothetical protein RL150_337 [Candidatus Parcubacteria bacterium]